MLLLLPEEKLQKLKSSALSLLENVPTVREVLRFFESVPGSSASSADGSSPLQGDSKRLDSGNFSTRRQGQLQKNL